MNGDVTALHTNHTIQAQYINDHNFNFSQINLLYLFSWEDITSQLQSALPDVVLGPPFASWTTVGRDAGLGNYSGALIREINPAKASNSTAIRSLEYYQDGKVESLTDQGAFFFIPLVYSKSFVMTLALQIFSIPHRVPY